jgi:hypothetical protein
MKSTAAYMDPIALNRSCCLDFLPPRRQKMVPNMRATTREKKKRTTVY